MPPELGAQLRRALTFAAVLAVVSLGAIHGWRASHWVEGEIPTYDVADYMLRAEHFRQALAAGDMSTFAERLFESNVHPPGLPLAMAVWALGAGPGFAGAATFSALLSTTNLLLLAVLGRQYAPVWGPLAGAAAAAVTAASPLHASLFAVPMTEPLGLFAVLSTLSLVAHRRSVARDVAVSACILVGALTRYNLAPMLLCPVALVAAFEAFESRSLAPTRTPIMATAVVSAYFGVWYNQNPAMGDGVERFFRNVDSGIPLFSVANLRWLWDALSGDVGASVAVAIGAVLGLGMAAVLRSRSNARTSVMFVALAVLALLLHRYKLGRNLYVVAPIWFVAASVGLLGGVVERARPLAAWGLLALGVAHGVSVRDQEAKTPRYYTADRHLRHALEAITVAAGSHDRVIVVGAHRELNKHLIELWLSAYAPETSVVFEEQYPPGCARGGSRLRQSGHCQLEVVLRSLAEQPSTLRTAYLAVSAWNPRNTRADWTTEMAGDLSELLGVDKRFNVATTNLRSIGMQVTVYAERSSLE